jgi:LPS sulfotransferase NodH
MHFESGGGARVLDAVSAIGGAVVLWERSDPVDAYVSMLKSEASGEWHCPSQNCVPWGKAVRVELQACRNYVSWYRKTTAAALALLEQKRIRHTRVVYEECLEDQPACFGRLLAAIGAEGAELPRAAQRDPRAMAGVVEDWEAVRRECGRRAE